ncbi:hypothetical protein SLS57_009024 [Botryosphaeria dothidea]
MDHLPIPKNPARPTPRIRYVCQQEYDRGDFLTYPERMGWTHEELMDRRTWLNLGDPSCTTDCTPDEAASFLQQWLFFGLLHVFFGDFIEFSDFIEIDGISGVQYVHTRNLLPLTKAFLETEEEEQALLRKGSDCLERCLSKALDVYDAIVSVDPKESLDPWFLASLGAMAKFLVYIADLLSPGDFDIDFVNMPLVYAKEPRFDRFTSKNKEIDIVSLEMAKAGWCPRQVAIAAEYEFETRYFCSQLQVFEAEKLDHGACTQRKCVALQVETSSYQPKHVRPDCKCDLKGVDVEAMDRMLKQGYIPLVVFDDDEDLSLFCTEIEEPASYVAISHVWSDGLGNPSANEIPLCQLRHLKRLVEELADNEDGFEDYGIPFWIDTLCCPARRSEAKTLAIKRMRETYENAAKVLVLSADLQTIEASALPVLDQVYLTSLSAWASRLWTLQEGALCNDLYVRFQDLTVPWDDQAFGQIADSARTLNLGWVDYDELFAGWSQVRGGEEIKTGSRDGPLFSIGEALSALSRRTTSVGEDEALCLGSILGANMGPISQAAPQDRMKALWAQFPSVPRSLLFWNQDRLRNPGFRWAPRSFLGMNEESSAVVDDPTVEATPQGLLARATAMVLKNFTYPLEYDIGGSILVEDSEAQDLFIISKNDQVLDTQAGMLNSFVVPDLEFTEVAIIFDQSIRESQQIVCTMVFVQRVEGEVTYARRGSSATILTKNETPEAIIHRKRVFDEQRNNEDLEEGDEYVIDFKGYEMYGVAIGVFEEEERLWCID